MEIKVELLQLCVDSNPYENGSESENWAIIIQNMERKFKREFNLRTLQVKVQALLSGYRRNQLKFKYVSLFAGS